MGGSLLMLIIKNAFGICTPIKMLNFTMNSKDTSDGKMKMANF